MTLTPTEARRAAIHLINEEAANGAAFPPEELETRCYQLVSLAAFSLYEISEKRLRSFLEVGGLDLQDPDVFDMASGMVSGFVGVNALVVSDLMQNSLVDMRHEFLKDFLLNEGILSLVENVKFQGLLWRESLLDA
jgi:hypothetical protein